MWQSRLFIPRHKNWPDVKKCLKKLSNGYTSSFSIFQKQDIKLESKHNNLDLQEGQEIEGFIIKNVSKIPEFQMNAIYLQHEDTGAQYLHLDRDDSNNTFSINLRTTPFNSYGVPHILEHTTLCGSKKYPCKDPFFKMLNRSLATFMNAMTAPDHTFYPFATQNEKDFYNLMSVYMDAVFNPQLKELDFIQEGWRLEHEKLYDPKSPLIFKGVVFNEMKGALADNQRIFSESLMNKILPSHTYSVISGGDPLQIPHLTYEQLKDFHAQYYHPSNAKFYSYGNFPLKNHLNFINEFYLKKFGKVKSNTSELTKVPSENRWTVEKKDQIFGKKESMAANPDKQSTLAISYLCCDIKDIDETFVLQVLSELLTSGPNSPFYKTLIEPNVGSGFSPVTGYESQTRDTYFSVGLQGLDPKDFDWVINTFNNTINNAIKEGFDKNRVNAVLHDIELHTKHQVSNFGMQFLYSISSLWNHDGDVIKALRVNDMVSKFKDNLSKNPHFLQDKVLQYFKQNNHKLTLIMTPDDNFNEKKDKLEQDLLKSKVSTLTPEMKRKIYEDGIKLKEAQDLKSNLECLPTLKISDIKKSTGSDNLKFVQLSNVPIQISFQPTNCLTYLRGVLDTSHLSEDLKPFIPLFKSVATKMGTKYHDYREIDQLAQLKTGGLNFSLHLAEHKDKNNMFEEGILFSSYSLDSNVSSMFSLWEEIFNHVTFKDKARLETLMKANVTALLNSLVDNGHLYVMGASAAMVNPASLKSDELSGLRYVKWLSNQVKDNKYEEILSKLEQIAENVLNKKYMRLAINTSFDSETNHESALSTFIKSLTGPFEKSFISVCNNTMTQKMKKIGVQYDSPLPVSYASKSLPTVAYTHKDFAPLRVLCRLLSSNYLLPMIREKGGAYGAGAKLTPAGVISFFSYRDPNPAQSFNTFDSSLNWVKKNEFSDQDVQEAILGTFQAIDSPVPAGARGARNFLYGISEEEFNNHRLSLMGVTKEDILRVASIYLDPNSDIPEGRALLGQLNDAVSKRPGETWTVDKL